MVRTEAREALIRDCIDMIRIIYRHDATGGDCHMVLDDGNVADDDIIYCLERVASTKVAIALEALDRKLWFYLNEYACLLLLLLLTEEEREECIQKGVWEDDSY